jgi:PilZ domain
VAEERRNGERAPFEGWVEIIADGVRRLGSGLDLSPTGIGVQIPRAPLPIRVRVMSEFALPGISLPLAIEGRVAWSDGDSGRVGVEFDTVDPGVVELLENYVAGRL